MRPPHIKALPVLDNLHVAAPCKASWTDMTGDDRSRFCGQCEKHVYNLSAMSRAEAHALIVEKEGKLCVRFYQRADGTILTTDCPDGVRRRNRKRRVVALTFGAMSAVAAAASTFVRPPIAKQGAIELPVRPPAIQESPKPPERPTVVMGAPPPMPIMGRPAARRPPVTMGKIAVPDRAVKGQLVLMPHESGHKKR